MQVHVDPKDGEERDGGLLADMMQQAVARELTAGKLIEAAGRLAAADRDDAIQLYKTWIAFNPDHPALHAIYFNYAVLLGESGDAAAAINALRESIRLKPDFGPAHINLGGLLERAGQPGQAVETWLALANALPTVTSDAINHKILALKQAGRVLEGGSQDATAEDALRLCLELDPGQQDAIQHWIALRQRQCKWPVFAGSQSLTIAKMQASISPLSAACYVDDPLFQMATAYNYARRTVGIPRRPRTGRLEVVPASNDRRRLRIGYVSSDLREHAVGFAMTDVLELHDRQKVEVFAYYCGVTTSDATQQRTMRAVEHWADLAGKDDAAAAQMIRQDGIDILVDLNGYTKDARTGVFAMRPAPIAVNWFGFPGSMGSPYHHYLIADEHVIPRNHEIYYSETIVRLPCYQPNDRKRVVAPVAPLRSQVGLPDTGFVFCCLNGMQKLTPCCFRDWMAILRQVPGSVLWLLSGTKETNDRLRHAAEQHGISGARIVFADKCRNPEHLARMTLADLFLDTFPYGAHTTASDALWMGLPVVTRQGRSFASRVCGSLVFAADLPELVCQSQEEYVVRAVELALHRPQLASIRERLRTSRDTCILFDTPNLVRSLESLYEQMQDGRLRGYLPEPDLTNLELYHEIAAAEHLEKLSTYNTVDYISHYREHLAEIDCVFPVCSDNRVWHGNH